MVFTSLGCVSFSLVYLLVEKNIPFRIRQQNKTNTQKRAPIPAEPVPSTSKLTPPGKHKRTAFQLSTDEEDVSDSSDPPSPPTPRSPGSSPPSRMTPNSLPQSMLGSYDVLPDIFEDKVFLLFGKMPSEETKLLKRYIVAYAG